MSSFYYWAHAWQPAWLRRLPQPLYEGLVGLFCVPLLGLLALLGWPSLIAPVSVTVLSALYELFESGAKLSDVYWRAVGVIGVYLGYLLIF